MELELTIAKSILNNIWLVFFIGIGCVVAMGFQMFHGLVF